jgi:hypothetical protein
VVVLRVLAPMPGPNEGRLDAAVPPPASR